MDTNEYRICLICSTSINESRLGIDACRKCADFYKRIRSNNRVPEFCVGRDRRCAEKGAVTSCRECRFDRFSRVLKKAGLNDIEDGLLEQQKKHVDVTDYADFEDAPSVDDKEENRKCLICSVRIKECRLGVDSCRACAVFYKRILSAERVPIECIRGDYNCVENGAPISCRKCRYDRFNEVLKLADSNDKDIDLTPKIEPVFTEFTSKRELDTSTSQWTFIDHNTFLLDQPSCSSTPLLHKIRWSYSLLCRTRKSAENGTKPVSFHLSQAEFEGSKMNFVPTTYSMVLPNTRIFISALYDFANMTFPDFANLDAENKELVISQSIVLFTLVDATYRVNHYFPCDLDTYFASYTTISGEAYLEHFLDGCPNEINKQDVIESLKVNIERTKSMNREHYQRVKPDDVEFTALLGLAFWNNDVAYVNEKLSSLVQKNRADILKELHIIYKARGKDDYAIRLGELLCLLDSMEENVTISTQESELFRLQNLFSEVDRETGTVIEVRP